MAADRIEFFQFVRWVVDAMEATELDYLIVGSAAAWAWGEPRTTLDVDLVIYLPATHVRRLSEELSRRGMLLPPDIILDLLLQPEGDLPLNAIHAETGYKADMYLLRTDDEAGMAALARRRQVVFAPPLGKAYVCAPDDLILHKLRYYALSGQTKHVRDIAGILTTSNDEIDWDYLNHWIEHFGLTDVWLALKAEISRLPD